MRPYYEHAGITIYHGDCREVLPELEGEFASILTDPPYGIALDTAEQAWLEVKRAISRWGRYQPWVFDNPITTAAVEALGKESLCSADETLVAERAHFMRIYESYRQRELEGVRVAAVTGREYRSGLPAPVLALLRGGKG